MNRLIERAAPSATDLVRRDHTALLATFHQFHATTAPRVKRGLVRSVCLALEVHAQVEEEILYAAVREVSQGDFLRRATSEHDEMRRRIAQLRGMSAEDPSCDASFNALMRDVMHHMADEETLFLPEAERVLRGRLGEVGAHMLRRRLELMAPRAPRLAYERARGVPGRTLALWAGVVLGGALLGRQLSQRAA